MIIKARLVINKKNHWIKSINHLKYAKGKAYKIIYVNIQKYHSASTLLLGQMILIFQC